MAMMKKKSKSQAAGGDPLFMTLCGGIGIPEPAVEFRFHPTRKWRLDYSWPTQRLALEVEGGIWIGGRHTRPASYLAEMEKYNALAVMGWRLLRCTPSTLCTTAMLDAVHAALEMK